jgi:hypothetical protein
LRLAGAVGDEARLLESFLGRRVGRVDRQHLLEAGAGLLGVVHQAGQHRSADGQRALFLLGGIRHDFDAVDFESWSDSVFLHIEHRPPYGNPRLALALENPQVASGCARPLAGTLVNHFIPKCDHSGTASDVDLMVVISEFKNLGITARIAESAQ